MDYPSQTTTEPALSVRLTKGLSSGIEVSVSFRHPREIPDIAHVFSRPAADPERTSLGLAELMMNAIEHGILGITTEEKRTLVAAGQLHHEVNRRLVLPEFQQKVASLSVKGEGDGLWYTVTDPGNGFDWRQVIARDPYNSDDLCGRGIAIAARVGFVELEYLGPGNVAVGRTRRTGG